MSQLFGIDFLPCAVVLVGLLLYSGATMTTLSGDAYQSNHLILSHIKRALLYYHRGRGSFLCDRSRKVSSILNCSEVGRLCLSTRYIDHCTVSGTCCVVPGLVECDKF